MRHVEAAPQASPLLCAQALVVCLPWLGKLTAEYHAINSTRYIAKRFWNAWRPYWSVLMPAAGFAPGWISPAQVHGVRFPSIRASQLMALALHVN